ncbi:acylglycerol-3-phosphate O-acyltransferase [Seminavis robusta]|uniref:Acylglycerol-3-phosphate O-acyltransferase n=1 Tax=Seminavis robusta TaxID=568900 RepID=A0A9N8E1B7_9STRA|nr:acylglycerol-3-phosphate O-acyltransferase [Seminavis robusta]|eukprot:Sro548_g164380.1 acylglycerol-3-phosphate O-acyltransferase (282) ;mRNA; f:22264-23109
MKTQLLSVNAENQGEDVPNNKTFQVEYSVGGQGRPTVVLLTGYGVCMEQSFSKIFDDLANMSTVVAYNRLNYGKSSTSEQQPQTAREIVIFLRQFLSTLQSLHPAVSPPFVVAGHSIGGMYAQYWARQYPDEVEGVVLLDSSHPDQWKRGVRQDGCLAKCLNALDALWNPQQQSEISHFDESAAQIHAAPKFDGDKIPLTVISAGKASLFARLLVSKESIRAFRDCQRDLAALSPHCRHIVADNSGHLVQNDQPDLVVQAIRDMLASIRGQHKQGKKDDTS